VSIARLCSERYLRTGNEKKFNWWLKLTAKSAFSSTNPILKIKKNINHVSK
jgi:hypothetical protein